MAIKASGTLGLGGSTEGDSINLELGKSAEDTISLDDAASRTLAAKTTPQETIMFSDFYSKINKKAIIEFPSNLLGGSTTKDATVINWPGGVLKASTSMTCIMQPKIPIYVGDNPQDQTSDRGSYLYWGVDAYKFLGWNTDGTPNKGTFYGQYWSSFQKGPAYGFVKYPNIQVYLPRKDFNTAMISNLVADTLRFTYDPNANYGTRAPYYSFGPAGAGTAPVLTMEATGSYPGLYRTNDFGAAWNDVPVTISITNVSSEDVYIDSWPGNSGSRGPFYLYWYRSLDPPYPVIYDTPLNPPYGGTRILWSTTAKGTQLGTSLTINGTKVSYIAPDDAIRDNVVNGLNTAINAAGISGVSSFINPTTKALVIYGLTSPVTISYGNAGGASNYEATVTNYGF